MGSRGASSKTSGGSTNARLETEIESMKRKFANRGQEAKKDVEKQAKIAKKLDGTKLGADFHGGKEGDSLHKIGSRTRWDNMFSSTIEDWSKGRNRPLGINDKDFGEVQSEIKKLSKKYDFTTIASAYNFAHTFRDYSEIKAKG